MSYDGEKKLNEKQKRFCEEYVKDNNGAQAAIRAGYSEKSARSIASEHLTKPNINFYINELKKELIDQCNVEAHVVLALLKKEAINPDNPGSTRVQALGLLAKHCNLLNDKIHHTGEIASPTVIKRIATYRNEDGEFVEFDPETGHEKVYDSQ